jgi:hypothetical protein
MKTPTWRIVERNRSNAQYSTGPKSPEGKAKSSLNAAKHSLTSKQVVIPGENPAEYDAHRADLIDGLKPANPIESELVEELAAHSWRLKRAIRLETAVLAQIAADSPDPDAAIAKSFLERPKELDRLVRYMTSIERAYWRVFNKLEAIQRARREHECQQAIEQSYLEALAETSARPKEAGGFVLKSVEPAAASDSPEPLRAAVAGELLPNIAANF